MSHSTAADFLLEHRTKYATDAQGCMLVGDVILAMEDYTRSRSQSWLTKQVKDLLLEIMRKAMKLTHQGEDHIWRPAVEIEAQAREIEFLLHKGFVDPKAEQ